MGIVRGAHFYCQKIQIRTKRQVRIEGSGAVDERFKSHAWKACEG